MKKRLPFAAKILILALPILGAVVLLPDWRLFTRAVTYPKNEVTASNWYKPLRRVAGKPGQPLPMVQPQEQTIPPAALKAAVSYAQEQNSSALLILHRGKLVLEQYWQGYSSSSLSNSMSMSKSVLALLIGIAIEEGHIGSVQDAVSRYLPEWSKDSRGDLTIEDLLYMQSGLRNDDRTDTTASDLVKMYLSSDADRVALHVPQIEPPRQRYDYNNVNSQILSIILERATGESYADYLSTRLWQPLQAADAFVWLDRPGGRAKPFCCLFAAPRDWVRLGQMLLNQGKVGQRQVVPNDWLERMLAPSPIEPTYGYHIWVKARTDQFPNVDWAASTAFVAPDTIYIDGRDLQRVYVIPSQDLVIVRVGEQPKNWDDSVIPNILVKSLLQATK
ncbi:MAG TPA: serine hydrolase [Leptolyngbyaceae cyanobacterium]